MLVDEELKSLIETTIFNDPRLSSQRIEVSPAAGHVTLEGTVQSFRRKLLAQQIVSSFDGVHRVTNQLVVTPSEPAPDDEIAKNVRAALDTSADVTKSSIQVSVTGGKVTLQGAVSSVWEQAVADDVVRGVRGVREVINLLIVNLQDKVAD